MAPSAVIEVPIAAKDAAAADESYSSGKPSLAYVDEEAENAPTFEDPYEERKYLKHRLVLAFHIFAQHGLSDGVAGHITMRDPVDPHSFWVNPFGTHFSLMQDNDLIRVDHEGKVVEGGARNSRLNYAAYAIHAEVHKARPDVLCAAHSHSLYGRAMSATGRTLDMLTQDFCVFYKDHVLYKNFAGLVLATSEGKAVAECLGNRKVALLGNHGIMTAGPTIEAAVAWFVLFENCCRIQLLADASSAGTGKALVTIGDQEAQATWEAVGTKGNGYFQALPLFQVAERQLGEKTYLGKGQRPW